MAGTWALVGTGLTIDTPAAGVSSVAAGISSTDVAVITTATSQISVYNFNGSIFTPVGTPLAITSTGLPSVSRVLTTEIAFIDDSNDSLEDYTWNGSVFTSNGANLGIATTGQPSISWMNAQTLAYIDSGVGTLRALEYPTLNWNELPGATSVGGAAHYSITALTRTPVGWATTYVAVANSTAGTLEVWQWRSGITWIQIGNTFNLGATGKLTICALSDNGIAVYDRAASTVTRYAWNGVDFVIDSTPLVVSVVGDAIGLTSLSSTRVVVSDSSSIMAYDFTPAANSFLYPPVASDVTIIGDVLGEANPGDVLTGVYTYSDSNGDLEGVSTFKWLRNGVAIVGATGLTYTVTDGDIDSPPKNIIFEVTPVALTGVNGATPVQSSGVTIVNSVVCVEVPALAADYNYRRFLASAPVAQREYRTVEFYHSQFPRVYRFVKDYESHTLKLEAGAPREECESVLFSAISMNIVEPHESDDGESAITFTIGTVGGELHEAVKSISGTGVFEPVQAIYRKYYSGDLSSPKIVRYVSVSSVVFESYEQATITAEDDDMAMKASGEIYTLERFPTLRGV